MTQQQVLGRQPGGKQVTWWLSRNFGGTQAIADSTGLQGSFPGHKLFNNSLVWAISRCC